MYYAEPDLSVFPEIDTSKGWHTAEAGTSYEAKEKRQTYRHNRTENAGRESVIGRLTEKKGQVAVKDRTEPAKKGYSL